MSIWESLKTIFINKDPIDVVFKEEWITYLNSNLPLYSRLPNDLTLRLREKIGEFISTTYFEGCGELELTDEMILTVAGQACMLIINHQGAPYLNLKTVLLYTSTFSSTVKDYDINGVVTEREVHRLGESWSNGTVILAWDSVQHGARNIYDGHNVTLHEFAHQLDQETGRTDGVPFLEHHEAYRTWGTVLGYGHEKLVENAERGKKPCWTIMEQQTLPSILPWQQSHSLKSLVNYLRNVLNSIRNSWSTISWILFHGLPNRRSYCNTNEWALPPESLYTELPQNFALRKHTMGPSLSVIPKIVSFTNISLTPNLNGIYWSFPKA